MTNAEKFKEIFGLDPQIDEGCPLNEEYCVLDECGACECDLCEFGGFWEEEYDENTNYVEGKKERY